MTEARSANIARIKTATQAAIRLVGGVEAAASCTRVGKTQISEYQNRNTALVVPVDVAIELDAYAQQPLILSAMATTAGYALLPIKLGEGCVATSMEHVAATAGQTMATTVRVLADGIVEPHEAADLSRDLAELIRVATVALQAVQAKLSGEKKGG